MNSTFFLFCRDVYNQFLFYFGGALSTGLLIYEHFKKAISRKAIACFFLFCLSVSSYQAWTDEHRNASVLIDEKSHLTAENTMLQLKVASQQTTIEYLRDHRTFSVNSVGGPDPQITQILQQLTAGTQGLHTQPGKAVKNGLVNLVKEMAAYLTTQKKANDKVSANFQAAPMGADEQTRAEAWKARNQASMNAELEMESNLHTTMLTNFGPRAMALLEEVKQIGASNSGVTEKDIEEATRFCTSSSTATFWGFQECIPKLALVSQKLR